MILLRHARRKTQFYTGIRETVTLCDVGKTASAFSDQIKPVYARHSSSRE